MIRGAALAFGLLLLSGCALVEYSDRLVDESTGRTNFVTQPASIGGIVGFIAGVPLDVAALPVTYVVYRSQEDREEGLDPLTTLLFPSFVLWRTGVIVVGAPFDLLEFVFYRAWRRPSARPGGPRKGEEPSQPVSAPGRVAPD